MTCSIWGGDRGHHNGGRNTSAKQPFTVHRNSKNNDIERDLKINKPNIKLTPFRISKLGFVFIQCPGSACANVFCTDMKFLYPGNKTAVLTVSHIYWDGWEINLFNYSAAHSQAWQA